MNSFNINSDDLSEVFWKKILESTESKKSFFFNDFIKKLEDLENLRKQSDYNTGSISHTSAWQLFSFVCFFKPKVILEVGTFIGKSTIAMALGADTYFNDHKTQIYSCDKDNEISLPNISKTKIYQFHKTTSTQMLEELEKKKIFLDLIHLDGRLQQNDHEILKKITNENSVYLLDDFEGTEKGVWNLFNMQSSGLIRRNYHILINPIKDLTKNSFNLNSKSTTACLIPISKILLTAQ